MPANCSPEGENPRYVGREVEVEDDDKVDVDVAAGERVEVEFRVECDDD